MTPRATPTFLHDVLGERFVPAELAVILAFAVAVASWAVPALAVDGAPGWRLGLAWLLVADIAAGCLANFTASTNDYYAERSANRWAFIAVHGHVVGVAWLLGGPMPAAWATWAFTVGVAAAVNALAGRAGARFVAATGVAIGALGLSALDVDPAWALVFGLFLVKVAYAFAVDHTAPADAPVDARDGLAPLATRDRAQAARLIGASFAADPLFVTVAGDDVAGREALAGALLDHHRGVGGEATGWFAGGRLLGLSLVAASERATPWRSALAAVAFGPVAARCGVAAVRWLNDYFLATRAAYPRGPHHQLVVLAVAPEAQGRGVGRSLVDAAMARVVADPASTALVLDTENPANVDLYARWGFAEVARVPLGDLRATVMARAR